MDPPDGGTPVFCVKTSDKKLKRNLFINIRINNTVKHPIEHFNEEDIVKEYFDANSKLEKYKIPFYTSPIFWSKEEESEKYYVIEVAVNDEFVRRKVLGSDILRHYLIHVVMLTLEKMYNTEDVSRRSQYLGHHLDLDFRQYEVLTTKQFMERSTTIVNNKIMLIEESKDCSNNEADDRIFDLYFRPSSKFLTLSIGTDRIPDLIRFNEDRIIVKLGEENLLDVYLSINIDLDQPVKYKFDDRLCLFRAVFKIVEPL